MIPATLSGSDFNIHRDIPVGSPLGVDDVTAHWRPEYPCRR